MQETGILFQNGGGHAFVSSCDFRDKAGLIRAWSKDMPNGSVETSTFKNTYCSVFSIVRFSSFIIAWYMFRVKECKGSRLFPTKASQWLLDDCAHPYLECILDAAFFSTTTIAI